MQPITTVYLSVYLPLILIGICIYAAVLIVLIVNRHDTILGTKFFNIHVILGIVEIIELLAMQFCNNFTRFGVLTDDIYLALTQGAPAQICSFSTSSIGVVQYWLISLVSLNRILTIIGANKMHAIPTVFNRYTSHAIVFCVIGPLVFYSGDLYLYNSNCPGINSASSDAASLNASIACQTRNIIIQEVYGFSFVLSKIINIALIIGVFLAIVHFKLTSSISSNHQYFSIMHEIKLGMAMCVLVVINGISTTLLIIFYASGDTFLNLLNFVIPCEDLSRLVTPIILFIFSKPLRKALLELKMKELRPAIIRIYQNGIPMREISRLLDVPKSTVIDDIERFEETGTNEDRAGRGRKRAARTTKNRQGIRGMLKRNPTIKRNSSRNRLKTGDFR